MNETIKDIFWIILLILVIIGIILWVGWQWNMCRDAGLPFWYCIQHIG